MGYHINDIQRGQFGEISKIEEELAELKDAIQQKNRIMELCELSDLCGAIEGYLKKHYPDFEIEDLIQMAESTKKAFDDGDRLPKDRREIINSLMADNCLRTRGRD